MTNYLRLSLALGILISASAIGRNLTTTFTAPSTAPTVLNLDGGMMIGGGDALPGAEIGISSRISDDMPLYLGAEFGAFLRGESPSYAVFPLMPTIYAQFQVSPRVRPILGVIAGPVISTGGGFSSVRFGFFGRPGINFDLGRTASLKIETRFGVIGSTVIFLPEVGAVFAI